MGYDSYMSGELVCEPGISDLRDWAVDAQDGLLFMGSYLNDESVQMVNGEIVVVGESKNVFECRYDDGFRADAMESTQALVDYCKKRGGTVNGDLRITGEENGDIWRISVIDNTVTQLRPMLVWPDGVKEQL